MAYEVEINLHGRTRLSCLWILWLVVVWRRQVTGCRIAQSHQQTFNLFFNLQCVRKYIFRAGSYTANSLAEDLEFIHDHVIKRKDVPCYWSFVRGIHRWILLTKASDGELWCFLWPAPEQTANNPDVGDLSRHRTHYGVTVMIISLYL